MPVTNVEPSGRLEDGRVTPKFTKKEFSGSESGEFQETSCSRVKHMPEHFLSSWKDERTGVKLEDTIGNDEEALRSNRNRKGEAPRRLKSSGSRSETRNPLLVTKLEPTGGLEDGGARVKLELNVKDEVPRRRRLVIRSRFDPIIIL